MFYKSSPTPTGCIIDHPHQVAYRSPTFQPIVVGGVPLHELAEPAPPRPPLMHFHLTPRTALPHSGLDHPPTQGLFPYLKLVALGQLLGGKRGPEIVPLWLFQNRQGLPL